MKKNLLLFVCLIIAQMVFAQDVIYMQNGDEIKASVVEVSDTYIKYHKADNPSGPLYSSSTDGVLMIIYKNGTKEIINKNTTTQNNAYEKNTVFANGVLISDGDDPESFNGEPIEESRYIWLAEKNCAEAAKQYKRGKAMKIAGNVLLGIGVPLSAAGMGCLIAWSCTRSSRTERVGYGRYSSSYTVYESNDALMISGATLFGFGSPLMIAGIPLNIIGKVQKKKSFNTFNKCAQSTAQNELQFKLMSNGIGVGVTF